VHPRAVQHYREERNHLLLAEVKSQVVQPVAQSLYQLHYLYVTQQKYAK